MEIRSENRPLGHRFNSITDSGIFVGETCYLTSLVITPEIVISDWPPQHVGQITIDDLEIILDLGPELILVGTGRTLQFLDSVILKGVIRAGIGIDFMDSHAACRTYNVLAAEDRHVAAGIIINP